MSQAYWAIESERQELRRLFNAIVSPPTSKVQYHKWSYVVAFYKTLKRQELALISALDHLLALEGRSRNNKAFHNVFKIPELAILILAELSVADLLDAMQVCHLFKDTVLDSAQLCEKLQLRPSLKIRDEMTTTFELPGQRRFPKLWMRQCEWHADGPLSDQGEDPVIGPIYGFAQDKLPRVGSRCRQMFICNPPIRRLHLALASWDWKPSYLHLAVIVREDGIRVDDLLQALQRQLSDFNAGQVGLTPRLSGKMHSRPGVRDYCFTTSEQPFDHQMASWMLSTQRLCEEEIGSLRSEQW